MNILVTGATRGIGKAIAKEMMGADCSVYAVGRNLDELKRFDHYCQCDMAGDVSELEEFVAKSKIDILINNAGEYVYGAIDKMTPEEIEHIYNLNLITPVRLITKAVPYMKEKKWGRIINIGSISGVMGEAHASLYSSTKSGLFGLTKALGLELAEYNITVNTINPGWVDTTLGKASIEDSDFSIGEIMDIIPQKRLVEPVEVAKLVKYLASEDAKGITGQLINLCAGLSVGI